MFRRVYERLPGRIQPVVSRAYRRVYDTIPHPTPSPFVDARKFVTENSPTIVDGGAHEGETIAILQQLFRSPTIHAFEPNPEKFAHLTSEYGTDGDVHLYNCALGDENGVAQFNVTRASYASSILEPTAAYSALDSDNTVERTVQVDVRPLDCVITDEVDVIKLDLQGYEYFALQGAAESLDRANVVISETMFNRNYENQPVFDKLDELLSQNNFKLYDFYTLKHWPDGQIRHADVLYVSEDVFEKTVRS